MKDLASLTYSLTETPAKTYECGSADRFFYACKAAGVFNLGVGYVKSCAFRVN